MGRAPDYPDEKSAIPGCPTEEDEDPDTTGTLSSVPLHGSEHILQHGRDQKRYSFMCYTDG